MAGESIFPDEITPAIQDADGSPRTIGQLFTVDEVCHADAGRVWLPIEGVPASYCVWELWDLTSGLMLAEIDMSSMAGDVEDHWTDWVPLDEPVELSPGVDYFVGEAIEGAPGYWYTDGVGAVFPVGTAPLSASTGMYQNGGPPGTEPDSTYAAYFFGADVRLGEAAAVVPAAGTTVAIPLATVVAGRKSPAHGTTIATAIPVATVAKVSAVAAISTGVALASATAGRSVPVSGQVIAIGTASATARKRAAAAGSSIGIALGSMTAPSETVGATLTAGGISATLTASGTTATLTASGLP